MDEAHGDHFAGHLAEAEGIQLSPTLCVVERDENRHSSPLLRLPSVCEQERCWESCSSSSYRGPNFLSTVSYGRR